MDAKPLTLGELEELMPRLRATLHEAETALQALYKVSALLTTDRAPAGNGRRSAPSERTESTAKADAEPKKGRGRRMRGGGRKRRLSGDDAAAAEEKISSAIKQAGKDGASLGAIVAETGMARSAVNYRLKSMRSAGSVKMVGNRRSARWLLA